MLEDLMVDSQMESPALKKMLADLKTNNSLAAEDQAWQEFTAIDKAMNPLKEGGSLSKNCACPEFEVQKMIEGFGLNDPTLRKSLPVIPLKVDLDEFERSSSGMQKATVSLMKSFRKRRGGSTGLPSEEMEGFASEYQHLMTPELHQAIKMAIKALDFPAFLRLMSQALSNA